MTILQEARIPESSTAYYDLHMIPPQWVTLSDLMLPINVKHGQTLVVRDARIPAESYEGLSDFVEGLTLPSPSLSSSALANPPRKKARLLNDAQQQIPPRPTASAPPNTNRSIVDIPPSALKAGFEKILMRLTGDATFKNVFPQVFANTENNSTAYRYFSTYKAAHDKGVTKYFQFSDLRSVRQTWIDLKQGTGIIGFIVH